ncbi:hypothetical protein [uncultured Eubacterium sp.]|uniref:hypothetical protein n=1 Tax=uncultured Eubacterium sp. TaxID=165185 RepID=UPI0025953078|nr:hypothetical protein [uncultured Eubacterium sp.]
MSRAEMRRQKRETEKSKTATYNLTQAQLDAMIDAALGKRIDDAKQAATEKAMTQAVTLMLVLPLEVLMDHYWKKSYAKRIPEFTQYVLEYFEKWENGELDMDELKRDLWEYGGVKLKAEDSA